MTTIRPRYTVTVTDNVAEALDLAAKRWPEDRPKLMSHLIDQRLASAAAERALRVRSEA